MKTPTQKFLLLLFGSLFDDEGVDSGSGGGAWYPVDVEFFRWIAYGVEYLGGRGIVRDGRSVRSRAAFVDNVGGKTVVGRCEVLATASAGVIGTSVPIAMRTLLLAQRVQIKHMTKFSKNAKSISLATMPTKGEPS